MTEPAKVAFQLNRDTPIYILSESKTQSEDFVRLSAIGFRWKAQQPSV